MTAATPTPRQIALEQALVSTARAQREPSAAHVAIASRRSLRLRLMGGATGADMDVAMPGATASLALDETVGRCLCGACGQQAAA